MLITAAMATFVACKKEVKTTEEVQETPVVEQVQETPDRSSNFPADVAQVFKAHGGIKAFDEKNTLVFEIIKPEGNEKHTTDLKSRHAKIETDKFALGYDGKEAWIVQDSTYFKGNPRFYHNLMFYFYAMPFVLGDDGITYEKVDDLKVGEDSYAGIKISYADGVGDSSKDNYFLYYDKATHEMKYLGYTVTYFSKEVSDKVSLIEYAAWEDVDGLKLPKTLKWRVFEEGKVGDVRSEVNFGSASASQEKLDGKTFSKPEETAKDQKEAAH